MPSLLDLMRLGGGAQAPQGASLPIPGFGGGMNLAGLGGGPAGMAGMGAGMMGMDLMAGRNPGQLAMTQPGRYMPQRRRPPQQLGANPNDPYAAQQQQPDPYAQPMPWWLGGQSSGR